MPMAITSEQLVQGSQTGLLNREIRRRGINVFDVSQIWGVGGYDKSGEYITGQVERPLFGPKPGAVQQPATATKPLTPIDAMKAAAAKKGLK